MSATGEVLVRVLVVSISIVVVEVWYLQPTVGFGQRMNNRHLTYERERKRRAKDAEGVYRDKDACRPGSQVFGPHSQHFVGVLRSVRADDN